MGRTLANAMGVVVGADDDVGRLRWKDERADAAG
jgi:hypothetical protein